MLALMGCWGGKVGTLTHSQWRRCRLWVPRHSPSPQYGEHTEPWPQGSGLLAALVSGVGVRAGPQVRLRVQPRAPFTSISSCIIFCLPQSQRSANLASSFPVPRSTNPTSICARHQVSPALEPPVSERSANGSPNNSNPRAAPQGELLFFILTGGHAY